MSETSRPTTSLSPDDALPPVEPPSAGFLVQLFVIPGLIVAIIVAVWLTFYWLANMGNDPRQYIPKLRGNAETRWQAAANLAGSMQGEAGDEIKNDVKVAQDLVAILNEAIDEGAMDWLADLPQLHRDPFDRVLIAQALQHDLRLVTVDKAILAYDVPTLPV